MDLIKRLLPYALIALLGVIVLYQCNRPGVGSGDGSLKPEVVTRIDTVFRTDTVPGKPVVDIRWLPAPARATSSRPAPSALPPAITNKINTYVDSVEFPSQNAKVILRTDVQGVLLDRTVKLETRQDTIIKERVITNTTTITQQEPQRIRLYGTISGGFQDLGPGATITTPKGLLYQYHYNVLQNGHQVGIGKLISFKRKKKDPG